MKSTRHPISAFKTSRWLRPGFAWTGGAMLAGVACVVGLWIQHSPGARTLFTTGQTSADSSALGMAPAPTASATPAPVSPTPAAPAPTGTASPRVPTVTTLGPTFDGRPLRVARTVRMLVTAYCPGPCCCGPHAHGITASGMSVETNAMHLVAAPPAWRLGTIVTIPGYDQGSPVPVLDRGGRIRGSRLDVLMPTHAQAQAWGARWLEVTVWEYAE